MGSENALSYGSWKSVWMLPGTKMAVLGLHVPTAQADGETDTGD